MSDIIIQGSEEWNRLRCGLITASKAADFQQKGQGVGYDNYMAQLVCERLTGCKTETFKNAYMERGNEDEPAARLCYEFETGYTVEQVAFIQHPLFDFMGMSPDGLIGSVGIVELKRKIPAIHIKYIFKGVVPAEYRKQMIFQLACCPDREWNAFASYCPELPENMQLFQAPKMYRDEVKEEIKATEDAAIAFNDAVNKMIDDLKAAVHQS